MILPRGPDGAVSAANASAWSVQRDAVRDDRGGRDAAGVQQPDDALPRARRVAEAGAQRQVAVDHVVERERDALLGARVPEQQHPAAAPHAAQRLEHRGGRAGGLDHEVELVGRLGRGELAGADRGGQIALLVAQAAHDDARGRPQRHQVCDQQRDRSVAEHQHLVARPRADLRQSLQHHGGRLDQRAVQQRHVVAEPVHEPARQQDLVRRRALAREAHLVVDRADVGGAAAARGTGPARDDALGDDAIARREALDARADGLHDAGPLVADRQRVAHEAGVDRAVQQLEIGAADADVPRPHEHLAAACHERRALLDPDPSRLGDHESSTGGDHRPDDTRHDGDGGEARPAAGPDRRPRPRRHRPDATGDRRLADGRHHERDRSERLVRRDVDRRRTGRRRVHLDGRRGAAPERRVRPAVRRGGRALAGPGGLPAGGRPRGRRRRAGRRRAGRRADRAAAGARAGGAASPRRPRRRRHRRRRGRAARLAGQARPTAT